MRSSIVAVRVTTQIVRPAAASAPASRTQAKRVSSAESRMRDARGRPGLCVGFRFKTDVHSVARGCDALMTV